MLPAQSLSDMPVTNQTRNRDCNPNLSPNATQLVTVVLYSGGGCSRSSRRPCISLRRCSISKRSPARNVLPSVPEPRSSELKTWPECPASDGENDDIGSARRCCCCCRRRARSRAFDVPKASGGAAPLREAYSCSYGYGRVSPASSLNGEGDVVPGRVVRGRLLR